MIPKYICIPLFLLLILSVLPITNLEAAGSGISFFKEEIFLTVGDSSFTVKGNYYFRNERADQARLMIFYPFPVDSQMSYPDSITVCVYPDDEREQIIAYRLATEGIRFGLKLESGEVEKIQVTYQQQLKSQAARYILESTKTWGGFLEEADYYIEVPAHLELTTNSYDDFTKRSDRKKSVYTMRKKRFLPETDIVLHWQEKRP